MYFNHSANIYQYIMTITGNISALYCYNCSICLHLSEFEIYHHARNALGDYDEPSKHQ